MSTWLWIMAVVILIGIIMKKQQEQAVFSAKHRKKGVQKHMKELAKSFIGKECIIYAMGNHQIVGTVKDVTESGLLVEGKGGSEVVNLDFVIRIRAYPVNNKGKKKSLILD